MKFKVIFIQNQNVFHTLLVCSDTYVNLLKLNLVKGIRHWWIENLYNQIKPKLFEECSFVKLQ